MVSSKAEDDAQVKLYKRAVRGEQKLSKGLVEVDSIGKFLLVCFMFDLSIFLFDLQ
jgi:hypothetical protein